MLRVLRLVVILAISSLAAAVAACGGGGGSPAEPSPVATAHHNESGAGERGVPPRPGERYLIVMKRVTAVPDPVQDEIRVTTDGVARYRTYWGGHSSANGRAGRRISARRFARLRTLVRTARLDGADRVGVKPTPGGYYYYLHVRKRVVPTGSGHLSRGVRPLINALDGLIDAMVSDVRF